MLKVSLDTVGYAAYFYEGEPLTLEEAMHRAARFGFDAVDIWPHRPIAFPMDVSKDRRKKLVELAAELNLKFAAIEAITDFRRSDHILLPRQEKEIMFVKECCELAHDVGCPVVRILAGPVTDRLGGARVTQFAGVGMIACAIGVTFFTSPASMAEFPWFVGFMLGLFFFAGVGNASTFKQMPMLFPPRQAGGVIGFTAAIAAYGPLLFGLLFGWSFGATRSPNAVFYGLAAFFALNVALNWWLYARRNAPHPC